MERSKRLLSLRQRKDTKQEQISTVVNGNDEIEQISTVVNGNDEIEQISAMVNGNDENEQISTMVNGNDEKEQENNYVIDSVQSEYFKKPKSPELLFRCSVCQKNLSHMNIERRNQHHNRCLDKQEELTKTEIKVEPKDSEQINMSACPICKKCIQSNRKALHLKACGSKHNLSTEKVLECLKVWQRHDDEYSTLGLVVPVNQPKQKRSMKLNPKSEQDFQLQLAKAMSASLEEEKNREKEMELVLLAGDQPIQLTYSNKITQRKKKNAKRKIIPEPILILRTEEERQKILSEKVANIISSPVHEYNVEESHFLSKIIEDNEVNEPKCKRNILKVDDHTLGIKIEKLWYLTGYSEYEEKEAFYVSFLKDFIAPTTGVVGNNLKDYADIPGRECSQRPTDQEEKEEEDLNLDHSEEEICPTQFALMDLGGNSPLNVSMEDSEIKDNQEKLSGEEASNSSKANSSIDKTTAEKSTALFNQETEEITGSRKLQMDMSLMVGNPVLSDVEIKMQNGSTIPAHCFVIYTRCPEMYKEIKKTEERLNSTSYFDLSSFSKNAVLAFLHYLYSAKVTEVEEVEELIALSKRYKVDDLFKVLTSEKSENNKMETLEDPHCIEKFSEDCMQMEICDNDDKSNSLMFESSFHHHSSLNNGSSALDESNYNEMEILSPLAETCDNVYFENISSSPDPSEVSSKEDISNDRIHSNKEGSCPVEEKSDDYNISVFEDSLKNNCLTTSASNEKIIEETDNDNLEISDYILQKKKKSNSVNSNSVSEKDSFSNIEISDSVFEKENSNKKIQCLISEGGDPSLKITSDNVKKNESNKTLNSDCAEKTQESQLVTGEFENSFGDSFSCSKETEENIDFESNTRSDLNSGKEDCSSKFFFSRRVVLESTTVDDLDSQRNSPDLFNEKDTKKQDICMIDLDIEQTQAESNFSLSKLKEIENISHHEASTSTPKQLSKTKAHIPGYRFSVSPIELSDKVLFKSKHRIVSEDYLLSPELEKENNSEADCDSLVFYSSPYYNERLRKPSETNSDSSFIEEIQPGNIGNCTEEKNGNIINPYTLNPYVEETINKRKDITKSPSDFQKDEVTDVINVSDNDSFLENNKEFNDIRSAVNLSESEQKQNQHLNSVDQNIIELTVGNEILESDSSFKPTVNCTSQKEKEDDEDCPSLNSSFLAEDLDGISQKLAPVVVESPEKDLMLVLESDEIDEEAQQKKPPRKKRGKNPQRNAPKKVLRSASKKSNQAPVTPMPNYESIPTPELKKELKKYGIRGLPKKKGIEYLKYIYEGTHPLVTDDDASFESKSADAQQLHNTSSTVQQMTAHSSQTNDHDISSSDTTSSYEDEILEESLLPNFKNCRKMSASQKIKNEETKTLIREFLSCRNDFLEKILLYEPFHVDELNMDFEAAGLKIKIENIIEVLDEECVTFSMATDSWSKRTRKRRSKQKSPIKRTPTKKRKM